MKRSNQKNNQNIKLKRHLELIRTTVRDLTPAQLAQVKGGTETNGEGGDDPFCPPLYTGP